MRTVIRHKETIIIFDMCTTAIQAFVELSSSKGSRNGYPQIQYITSLIGGVIGNQDENYLIQ